MRTNEEVKADSERHRRENIKTLTATKKEWRRLEKEQQDIYDEQARRTGGTPLQVRQRELPWHLADMYNVPSCSEDEEEFARRERERKTHPQVRIPFTQEVYDSWLGIMDHLSGEDTDERNYVRQDSTTVEEDNSGRPKKVKQFYHSKRFKEQLRLRDEREKAEAELAEKKKKQAMIPTKVCESVNANFRNTTSSVTLIKLMSKPTLVLYLHLCISFNVMKHLSLNIIGYTCIYFEVSEDMSLTYVILLYLYINGLSVCIYLGILLYVSICMSYIFTMNF